MAVNGRIVALVSLLLCCASGCGRDWVADPAVKQQVYFDQETGSAVVADAGVQTPAVHPATGRRTLSPALYCNQCRVWRAAPPLEEAQRNPRARQCSECGGGLSAEGPAPDEAN